MIEHPTRDATTGEEIAGTIIPEKSDEAGPSKRPQNAFAALMSKKPKLDKTPPRPSAPRRIFAGADGLGAYIADPNAFGPKQVIYHNETAVMINDLYPKSTIHTLVLPRDPSKNLLDPLDALSADAAFLAAVKAEVARAKEIVGAELRRRYGSVSVQERARNEALNSDEPVTGELPPGRDWVAEVRSGVHAHPSMNHLHVHVFSPDMVSECMRHRKHYLTFNTTFLVPLEAFPLTEDDPLRHPGRNGVMDGDLECWRCGVNFGNKFAKLKRHLEEELEVWKRL